MVKHNYYLYSKFKIGNKYDRWRKTAKILSLPKDACQRLEWMIFYQTKSCFNARLNCRYFGISPKTFYKWHKRFDDSNLRTLEEQSKSPKQVRQKEFTPVQFKRVVEIRRSHIRYGKNKLLSLYQSLYPEDLEISAWKIQCIIQKSGMYYHPKKQRRINRKRQLSQKRKKITELKQKKINGFLLCLDTIVVYCKSKKRYILTAIDKYSKLSFARMYTTHSSYNSRDFLYRLNYLLDGKIENIQTDNGSEFRKYFDQACSQLDIPHYFSRNHTPKDNAVCERFNKTLKEEFIQLGNMSDDTGYFNKNLTEWLIHYNFQRPHQTLSYMSPINFTYKYHKVLPMYPSSTKH